jgi:hypothetical protein
MAARPYKASGNSESGAIPVLVLGALAVGVIVGAVESWVSQWFSLLIIFPLAIGGAVGVFAAFQVERGMVRAPLLAALIGFLGGLAGQGTVHVVDYTRFRSDFLTSLEDRRQAFIGEHSDDEGAVEEAKGLDLAKLADDQLEEETGSRGFMGYVKLAAREGTEIKRTGQSSGTKVSGMGTYILWLVEFLFAGGLAFWMALERAKKPFCEISKKWFDREDVLAAGSGDKAQVAQVLDALQADNWSGALSALGQADDKTASVLTLERCSHCEEHEPILHLKVTAGLNTAKPVTKVRYTTLLKPDDARIFLDHAKKLAAEHEAAEKAAMEAAAAAAPTDAPPATG